MKVEVVYASKDTTRLVSVNVPDNCSIQHAIQQSGLLADFPEIDLNTNEVGIWGEKKPLASTLQANDRIEIYRPLLMSPTEARRLRALRAEAERSR